MQLAERQSPSVEVIKSFSLWVFTLTVCLLVVGFPIIVLMAAVASLLSIVVQAVLPVSGVLFVVGSILGLNVLGVILGAVVLTSKGIRPQDVSWLRWLHGSASPLHKSVYASCPLTCDVESVN